MNFLHGNDKKRIKSALNDKKTKHFPDAGDNRYRFYVGGHSAASEGS